MKRYKMRKIVLALSFGAMIFFAGCGNSPEDAVKDFYKGIANSDMDLIQKSTTPQAFGLVSMAITAMPAAQKARLQDGIEIVKVEKQGDHTAIVQSKIKSTGEMHSDTVVEIDGKWKVDAKK
jgi:hypothetical protein